ncbi:hypothetical protein EVAR_7_1 [Eumeta japonica]|uniref:Uncharacterized protein n=1 Tax=Eumeta variegata TaxID=151549 RepID=A0A4C1S7L0_EUMVA|nr:hypothetical protein EVAR_7_1 [Eumeta japonica]
MKPPNSYSVDTRGAGAGTYPGIYEALVRCSTYVPRVWPHDVACRRHRSTREFFRRYIDPARRYGVIRIRFIRVFLPVTAVPCAAVFISSYSDSRTDSKIR